MSIPKKNKRKGVFHLMNANQTKKTEKAFITREDYKAYQEKTGKPFLTYAMGLYSINFAVKS